MEYQSREDRLRELEREREQFNNLLNVDNFDYLQSERFNEDIGLSSHRYMEEDDLYSSSKYSPLRFGTKSNTEKPEKHPYIDLQQIPTFKSPKQPCLAKSLIELEKQERKRELAEKKEREQLESRIPPRKPKLHFSDKALIAEERTRYAQLESAYHKLLSQVQKLQATHLNDLRATENRFHSASNAMQRALVSKSEEVVNITNKLVGMQAKYERESRSWNQEKQALKAQIGTLDKDFSALEEKTRIREQRIGELNQLRKDLSERVAFREQDLIKYSKALRELDGELKAEKESKLKQEAKALELEQENQALQRDLKETKKSFHKLSESTQDYEKIKIQFSECKRECDDLSRREKNYLTELENISSKERKMYIELEELSVQHRKYLNEISKLTARSNALSQETEILKTVESSLRSELAAALQKNETYSKDINELQSVINASNVEVNRYSKELNEIQQSLREAKSNNQNLQSENIQFKFAEEKAKRENAQLLHELEEKSAILDSKNAELDLAKAQINELTLRVEQEIQSKNDLRMQNKDKLTGVSQKITGLQETLAQTQLQLEELQRNEGNLRQTIKQREEAIRSSSLQVADLENTNRALQGQIQQISQELEALKSKKRDDMLVVQDKFVQSKARMDQEISMLKGQLNQKQQQLQTVIEESSKLKLELSEFSSDRFNLETRLSELMASESSYQRQVASLQSQLAQKSQDVVRSTAKNQAMEEQLKKLDDEIKLYRNGSSVDDGDIQRLQNNMQMLSKRLKTQVNTLLDEPKSRSSSANANQDSDRISHARSNSKYAVSANLRNNSPTLTTPRLTQDIEKQITDDFEQVEKLFEKSNIKQT